ncbi:alcohol dehydrogenase catalytic domain-containing protein [Halorubrum sp. CBA1125]|uniref:2,3-butanediol dehydrogenase n=1 Tax=Halorubrum sp. CBA1125 TaxID=2668072 RepID=UPI0012E703F0|nr:2,3-butanediol dehydrogenase [Halorubrum sp. CBA1125]MUW13399.1 alcohol dehydrogenase catalytic domain-containing protein [Halorubrum sp. CBA1125]
MRAAQYYGKKDVRVEEIDDPPVGEGEVEISIAYAGICGTDRHEYVAGPILIPDAEPHPATGERLPVTLGHEVSGTVEAVGEGVTAVEPGDRVTVNPMLPCGECQYCLAGKHNVCVDLGFVGLSGGGGGFAERLVVDEDNAVPIPDDVSLKEASLVEPFSVGLHAVRHSPVRTGDSVAVFGTGPIGLTVIQAARAAGARRILVSEPQAGRREIAEEIGADVTLDPTEVDPVEEIRERTEDGVEVAFEVAGVDASFSQALRSTQHDGHLRVVSVYEDDVTFNPNEVVTVERTISGTNVYTGGPRSGEEYGMTLSMIESGAFDPSALITDLVDLDDVVAGFESLLSDDGQVKILVEP